MISPIWHTASLDSLPPVQDAPVAWYVRLDDPAVQDLAQSAPLRPDDLRDLAQRPQSAMRGLRRQLTKALLAKAAGLHPDAIALDRTAAGAPLVLTPEGWHVSVAGHWPHALIGVSRAPLGVDLEPMDALPPPDDALTDGERSDLAHAPDQERLRRWVAKEAHAKLLGVAAQIDPAHIHTQADGTGLRVHSAQEQTFCDLAMLGQTICAVARL